MPDRGTMAPTPGEALCTAQDVALNGFWQAYAPRKTAEQIVKDGHGLSCGRCLRRLLWHGRWALRPPGAATPCAHAPTTTVLVQVPVRQVRPAGSFGPAGDPEGPRGQDPTGERRGPR